MNSFKNEIKNNFTAIPNTICNDSNLSWKAKGILLYLASKPDDWKFYMNEIKLKATDGKSALQSGIKELEDFGYLVRDRSFDDNNKFNGYNWILQDPSSVILRQTENRADGNCISRETALHNKKESTKKEYTNINNKDYVFEDFFEGLIWSDYRLLNAGNKAVSKGCVKKLKQNDRVKLYYAIQKCKTGKPFDTYNYPLLSTFVNQKRYLDDWDAILKQKGGNAPKSNYDEVL